MQEIFNWACLSFVTWHLTTKIRMSTVNIINNSLNILSRVYNNRCFLWFMVLIWLGTDLRLFYQFKCNSSSVKIKMLTLLLLSLLCDSYYTVEVLSVAPLKSLKISSLPPIRNPQQPKFKNILHPVPVGPLVTPNSYSNFKQVIYRMSQKMVTCFSNLKQISGFTK